MQAFLIFGLAAPLITVVVLMVVGPLVAVWDWLKHPTRLMR
jgi:hypothetical protein